ncbi:MAG: DUF4331 family protein [Pseudomonadaceae bacterium]|nr:DUF4331 family protein [Pseudomonadaceae bacterium]
MVLIAGTAGASSHREAPFITKLPQVDATDFYMFKSYEPGREDYVTFIANYIPVQAAYGGPNYFPLDADAVYEISIDNDGDANEDLTFRFDFSNDLPAGEVLSLDIDGTSVTSVLHNRGAFRALYEQTSPRLYSVALRMLGNSTQAEDVLQDVYLKVWHAAAAYTAPRGDAIAWMVALARIERLMYCAVKRPSAQPANRSARWKVNGAVNPRLHLIACVNASKPLRAASVRVSLRLSFRDCPTVK